MQIRGRGGCEGKGFLGGDFISVVHGLEHDFQRGTALLNGFELQRLDQLARGRVAGLLAPGTGAFAAPVVH